ncbi:hypothetical protein LMG24238_07646 [Paraburkholderia sediminicola]|uniref:Uncharacterized protein n=1 Tax=Paraburkholderia sediminicola TaxID=458836 RepID=A0A6J5CVJ4_9BURK|nr:hypothetical protein LMG24238_07646 [Paraburkholderia sediminicola]
MSCGLFRFGPRTHALDDLSSYLTRIEIWNRSSRGVEENGNRLAIDCRPFAPSVTTDGFG